MSSIMEQGYNDKNKFIESYDAYADAIFRYCLFRVSDRERAKELMQETFTRTWEYLQKDNNIENIRAFLYKVAHNLCVNEYAHPKMYSLDEMKKNINFDPEGENADSLEHSSEITLLLDKMMLLSEDERNLLTMRYIDDLQVLEIAELLEMLPNTISVKLRRAQDSLRKLYK